MKQSLKLYLIALLAAITVVVVAYLLLRPAIKETGVEAVPENEIVVSTHAVLDSIRSIGQWELTAVDVQADVDTIQTRWFGIKKERLQRRYFGRMSIGVDMQKVVMNDSVMTLPHVGLLDEDFIDESLTELIICDSKSMEQDPKIKAAMLAKAKQMMIRDGLKPYTIADCEQRAREEILQRLKLLKQDNITITFK